MPQVSLKQASSNYNMRKVFVFLTYLLNFDLGSLGLFFPYIIETISSIAAKSANLALNMIFSWCFRADITY